MSHVQILFFVSKLFGVNLYVGAEISTDTYEENFEYVVNAEGYVAKITITDNDKEVEWIFEIQYEK